MPRRADPRYEITPVTPRAARKKFEGVVAGAWKPFVSLSLRRFVHRAPYIPPRWFLVFSLRGTSNKSRTIVSRGTFHVPRLHRLPTPSSAATLPNREGSGENNSKWSRARIQNLWNALLRQETRERREEKRRKRISSKDGKGGEVEVEVEEDERVKRFSWILVEYRAEERRRPLLRWLGGGA